MTLPTLSGPGKVGKVTLSYDSRYFWTSVGPLPLGSLSPLFGAQPGETSGGPGALSGTNSGGVAVVGEKTAWLAGGRMGMLVRSEACDAHASLRYAPPHARGW